MSTATSPVSAANAGDNPAPGFRRVFRRWLGFDARTGLALLLVFSVVRMVLVLQASVTGSYQAVSVVFVAMAVLPWIVLTRAGRRRIGVVRPTRARWIVPGVLAGGATCLAVFALFSAVWGETMQNAFVYIGGTYSVVPTDVSETDRAIYFAIFAVIGLTFSPLGEELLYRGIAQESFTTRMGAGRAALLDAGAFAVVHLAHFGIVFVAGNWAFFAAPAAMWFVAMFASAIVFYAFKRLTGSIIGAIASHAGFNLVMTAIIFYALDLY